MRIMKNGFWIGSLVLAVLTGVAELRGEDTPWKSIRDVPNVQTSAITLEAPVAMPVPAVTPIPTFVSSALPEGAIQQASFETSASASSVPQPPLRQPLPEIIAVSAPLSKAATPTAEEPEDQSETLFATDRPFRRHSVARPPNSGIVQVSTTTTTPVVGAVTGEVPMVPGWEAPVDTSWGAGVPTGPIPDAVETAFGATVNPVRPRFYADAEYLLWWIQGQSVPVLATTSAPSDFGVLGAPTTQVLFGGNQIGGSSPYSGGRFTVGAWLGCEQTKAVEFTGFFLGPRSTFFSTNASMNPVIGRPFLEANNGQETAQLTSLPQVANGMLTINAPTSLWGLEGNLLCQLCCGCNYRLYALAGFRNINLDESLTITENIQGLPTAPAPFTNQMITVTDRFATQNHFYGGQVGLGGRWYWGRFSVEGRGKVALGDTVQLLDITGSQRFVSPTGVVQNFTGGLLALPSNIGHFSNNAFSVVPEIGVNVGYQILPYLRGFVGYNFLYWSNVIRPGTSIDRVVDVTQIPNFPLNPEPAPVPGRHPAPVFHEVGLWAQGVTFGLEFNY
jgi:hypothetical protein